MWQFARRLSFLFVLLLLTTTTASAWDLNDVSILLPLPAKVPSPALLAPSTQGRYGELVPKQILSLLPRLTPLTPYDSKDFLAAVGFRIDPCFRSTPAAACTRQIRVVWQPLTAGPSGEPVDADVAVHSFYNLSDSEFADFARRLAALNGPGARGLRLQVHPLIARQGLDGPYWHALRALLLEFMGAHNLVRVTFMTEQSPMKMWDFGGVDIAGDRITRIAIPRVGVQLQSFLNTGGFGPGGEAFKGGLKPAPSNSTEVLGPMVESSSAITAADGLSLRRAVDAAFKIENPRLHSSETIDCASCHAAQPARLWAVTTFPDLGLGSSRYEFSSNLGLDLSNATADPGHTHLMRAFGYHRGQPAISQRAINESALAAERMNQGR